MARILFLMMFPFMCFSQITPSEDIPVNNLLKEKENLDTKRKASYNLEEIKVRWKKAALENCPGGPCVVAPSFTCGTSTVTDVDGNPYNTVLIGTQCWTKENLKVTKYNDGTLIATGLDNATWGITTNGAFAIYNNVNANDAIYGKLYNWYAVNDSRKLCPNGWHVPSDGDWRSLILFLDPTANVAAGNNSLINIAGGKMKSTSSEWFIQSIGSNNSSGFSALPGGTRLSDGTFSTITFNALFWSASEKDITRFGPNRAQLFWINTGDDILQIDYSNFFMSMGCSIRCLKD